MKQEDSLTVENQGGTVTALVKALDSFRRIPVATYRVQFNREFTFSDARSIVSYLNALGISDCYASPYFKAKRGSLHGYDIVDHNLLNPEIYLNMEKYS